MTLTIIALQLSQINHLKADMAINRNLPSKLLQRVHHIHSVLTVGRKSREGECV
jgi:hypothetical protein